MAELTVDLLLDDKSFKRSLDNASRSAEKSGKKIGQGITAPVKSSFKEIGNIAKGFVVGNVLLQLPRLVSSAFSSVTRAAIAQEDAVNSLNAALRRTGDFSESVSKDLQRFASDLQNISIVGDEVILSQIAYAKSLGLSNDQTKEFITAALNASAALDRDFNGVLVQLLKTLSGVQGEVKELVPQIGNLTQEQLKAGGAAKLFNEQFAGAFTAQTNTTSGSLAQLTNSFGDFTEKLGAFIIESNTSINAIRQLTQGFNRLNLALSKDVADQAKAARIEYSRLNVDLIKLQQTLSTTNDPVAIRQLQERISFVKDDLSVAAERYKRLKAQIEQPVESGISRGRILSQKEIDEAINGFKTIGLSRIEQIKLQESEQIKALDSARKFNNDRIISEQEYQKRLSEVRRQAREQEAVIQEQQRQKRLQDEEAERQRILNSLGTIQNFSEASGEVFKQLAEDFRVTSKQIGESLVRGIGVGAGNAFAAFGRAAATGENVLKAFSDALFQSISSQAVALGTNYVLSGTAMLFSPNPKDQAQAPFLIKAGAALAAFGGFLGGTVGGGAGQSSPSTGQGVSGAAFQPETDLRTDLVTEERLEPETRVNVVINGSVFDSEETGLRISKILENASLNENVRIVGGIA